MKKSILPQDIRQFEINSICSCLLFNKIKTTQDLTDRLEQLVERIQQNPQVFKTTYTTEQCFEILKMSISRYNAINAFHINLNNSQHMQALAAFILKHPHKPVSAQQDDDLSRVTKSYDRFEISLEKEQSTSKSLLSLLKDKDFSVIPEVILGSGDNGTTLWLEKFKALHGTTSLTLSKGQLPPVIIIGENSGSWKHDYTLAQTYGALERDPGLENPGSYLSTEHDKKNPYANARHVFQANQTNLAYTDAPLLRASVLKIEKRELHEKDWKSPEQTYRVIVQTPYGTKKIYTDLLNICTGLGPSRNIIADQLLPTSEFQRLNQFDEKKGFTPIVDGNKFMLTCSEEHCKGHRTIIIYGGGGTAAACFRKGFYGHDIRTEYCDFSEQHQKNSITWISKQLDTVGTGKLAVTAVNAAQCCGQCLVGVLTTIQEQSNGKLLLTFQNHDLSKSFSLECDQLVCSVGQDDQVMRGICNEIEGDLELVYDGTHMVLNVSSPDKKLTYYGAAAMAVRGKEYSKATWEWLQSENIQGDVGPGSMPPSRAQIRRYLFITQLPCTSVHANMDSTDSIKKFFENAGIPSALVSLFLHDLLLLRKGHPSGAMHEELKALLIRHHIDHVIEVKGDQQFVLKGSNPGLTTSSADYRPLSWLHPQRNTADATIFVSSVTTDNTDHGLDEHIPSSVELSVGS